MYHDFPSKLICLTVPKHFVEEPFCVSEKFGYRKILRIRGVYLDFASKLVSHSTQTFCRGTLLCFRKIRVSKSFMHKKGTSLFSVEIFCFTLLNNIAGDPSVLQKNSGFENFHKLEAGHHDFVENFCLTGPKKFVRRPFCVSEIF